jgi:hypothetical protein
MNKHFLSQVINDIVDYHNISVNYRKDSCGRCYNTGEIEIPYISSTQNFITALHEIGHSIKNAHSTTMPKHVCEYIAIKYSYHQCLKYGVEIPERIKIEDQRYIKKWLCEDARKYEIKHIKNYILEHCNINAHTFKHNLKQDYLPYYDTITKSIIWKSNSNENRQL